MRTICAWCGREISGGEDDDGRISHGMCEECSQKIVAERQGRRVEELQGSRV